MIQCGDDLVTQLTVLGSSFDTKHADGRVEAVDVSKWPGQWEQRRNNKARRSNGRALLALVESQSFCLRRVFFAYACEIVVRFVLEEVKDVGFEHRVGNSLSCDDKREVKRICKILVWKFL